MALIIGTTGADSLFGTSGDDELIGMGTASTYESDYLSGGDGTIGANLMAGSDLGDILKSGGGNDWILGNGGNDTLVSGVGNDMVRAGTGADRCIPAAAMKLCLAKAAMIPSYPIRVPTGFMRGMAMTS